MNTPTKDELIIAKGLIRSAQTRDGGISYEIAVKAVSEYLSAHRVPGEELAKALEKLDRVTDLTQSWICNRVGMTEYESVKDSCAVDIIEALGLDDTGQGARDG